MKARRKCDTPSDGFSAKETYDAPAKRTIEPGSQRDFIAWYKTNTANEKAEDERFFAGVIDQMRSRAARSRRWLESIGWELVGGSADVRRLWRKKIGGDRHWAWSSNFSDTTALEKASFDMFQFSDSAAHFAENGDWPRALHFGFMSGFHHGLAHARFRQAEGMKGRRRSTRREEVIAALERLAADRGPDEIAKLPPKKLATLAPELEARSGDEKGSIREMICAWRKSVRNTVPHA